MHVLNLSLDRAVLDANSPVAKRIRALSATAGEVIVLTPFSRRGGKIARFFALWKQAKRVLSKKRFNLITVQDTVYLALLAYLLARKFGIPLEVQVHGFEKFYGIRKLIAHFVLCRADKIRVVSERLKREISERAYVLPVYAQIDVPIENKKQKKELFTFLTVGRLVPVKNVGLQIRAFARIAKEFPNAQLVIVGDGPERENMQKHSRVIFEGTQRELSRFYQNADAFLLTSNSEGWGVAITEAAAHGLPIIMTDVGCAGEFIKNGENGIVIPVGNEDALVVAMKRIITDAELRARLARAARSSFSALPSPEEQIKKQIAEWRQML